MKKFKLCLSVLLLLALLITSMTACGGPAGEQGLQGVQGEQGPAGEQGSPGEKGDGIASISKTNTEGLVDTYTITYTNGETTTFTVTNGAQGQQGIQGIQGIPGKDGKTPVITIQGGYWYIDGVNTNQSAAGLKGDTGNGISSIAKTGTEGLVDTYTITYTNGDTTTFTVTNGAQGEQGIQGVPGKDGSTPTITIQDGYWYINGVNTNQSAVGVKGDDGLSAFETYQKYHPEYTGTEAEWIESLKGSDGAQGEQGVSVVNAYVDSNLHLWIELSNGTKIDAGYVGVNTNPPAVTTYTVTFKDWNGTVLKTQDNVESGAAATAPADPTRDGYTFTGWDKAFNNVTSNLTVTATYTQNTVPTGEHTVTFYDYDGVTILATRSNVAEGGNAALPVNPTKTGATFLGWKGTYTNVTKDESVIAVYSDSKNVFAIESANGSVGNTVTLLVDVDGIVKTCGFDMTIYYDNSVLELTSYDSDLDLDVIVNDTELENGILLNFSAATEKTKQRDIISLTFTIKSTTKTATEVTIAMTSAKEIDGQAIIDTEYTLINGVVTIQ